VYALKEVQMAKNRMDVTTFVGKLLEEEDVDALREGVRVLAQLMMETEVSSKIGADPYERTDARLAYRNGYRTRTWNTRVGTIELKIPKITRGSYFPSLLDPRRRAEKALYSVVTEAYVKGVSTRKVDDLVRALGIEGISKSEVSRMCKALDRDVEAFRTRPIEEEIAYLWLDATFHKVREIDRVIPMATVVAVGVTSSGERTVLGVDCGPSEDHAFWVGFLRSLLKRGLKGVQLVISDSHEGLKQAVMKVLHAASWQRCRVHFMRNLLSLIPKDAQQAVAAIVRMIFVEPDHASAMAQLKKVASTLHPRFPKAAELLEEASEDLLSHLHFPPEHRRRLHSTNPLERLHKEIKRRTHVVGIFPNRASLLRLVGALLAEQDDEWQVADRRYFSIGSMEKIGELEGGEIQKELLAAIA
jgi:putative transposase